MLDPLCDESPKPPQITKTSGGTGTVRLTSIKLRSPLESCGSIESPSTAIIHRSPGLARNSWPMSRSVNSHATFTSSSSPF